jgi:histidine triad (HIT) family protein
MARLSRILFTVARSRLAAAWIGWSFAYMSWLLPVERLYETEQVMAFHHPRPSHKLHILIVPKRSIRTILDLASDDTSILAAVVAAAQYLVKELALEERGFRLIVNGGAYQDVMQVHWHLVSDGIRIDTQRG